MTTNATAYWRARPSGNNNNGGGFDCLISPAASGSNLTWATSGGVTTVTDTVAAAFTTGMVNSAINIAGIEQLTILTRVDASNITVTTMPPWQPANSNGAKYNWTVGSGTDYSQQNSAQVTQSSTANTSTSTTTLTDTGASFTAALIGNGIRVAGTGISTTFTFITAVPSGTTLTLQTSPGTTGTSVSYNIGGGWADFFTNTTANIVAGNTVYMLGGASPNYTSPDYTSNLLTPVGGNLTTGGKVTFAADPATPTTNGFGGRPLVKTTGNGAIWYHADYMVIRDVFLVAGLAQASGVGIIEGTAVTFVRDVILDQNGYDQPLITGSGSFELLNFEVFSSAAKRAGNTQFAIRGSTVGDKINWGNVHDVIGPGIQVDSTGQIANTIIAKCGADSLTFNGTANNMSGINLTIDGGAGHGVVFAGQFAVGTTTLINCLITNHTTAGKYAIIVNAGTQAQNDRVKGLIDYNSLYNNAGSYNAISPGAHDTVLSSDPYVAQGTENYTLA